MEVWYVALCLRVADDCYNYETIFKHDKLSGVFEDNGKEYVQTDAIIWSRKTISKEITINKSTSHYKAIIGLNKEPSQQELDDLHFRMKNMLRTCIKEERDYAILDYNRKLSLL